MRRRQGTGGRRDRAEQERDADIERPQHDALKLEGAGHDWLDDRDAQAAAHQCERGERGVRVDHPRRRRADRREGVVDAPPQAIGVRHGDDAPRRQFPQTGRPPAGPGDHLGRARQRTGPRRSNEPRDRDARPAGWQDRNRRHATAPAGPRPRRTATGRGSAPAAARGRPPRAHPGSGRPPAPGCRRSQAQAASRRRSPLHAPGCA